MMNIYLQWLTILAMVRREHKRNKGNGNSPKLLHEEVFSRGASSRILIGCRVFFVFDLFLLLFLLLVLRLPPLSPLSIKQVFLFWNGLGFLRGEGRRCSCTRSSPMGAVMNQIAVCQPLMKQHKKKIKSKEDYERLDVNVVCSTQSLYALNLNGCLT